jgi:hypothetical protein
MTAAQRGPVDHVVVDEARHVDELDRGSGRHGVAAILGCEKDEQRPEPLAAGRKRLSAGLGDRAWMARDGLAEAILQRGQVRVEARSLLDGGEGRHLASPMTRTTMPPPSRRCAAGWKPAARTRSVSSAGPGNRRTLAGR